MPAAVAGVKAPMRSEDRIERVYLPSLMDPDSDISSFDQPSNENLIRTHSPHHINHVTRTPTPVVNTMGGHVGPQGPHDDGVHPTAPPAESEYGSVSAPPSYRSPRDSISQPQSEPPSYPSSGPPSLMRQQRNRPSTSAISFRLRVPPPSYDEAMEKREEAKGFGEGGVSADLNWLSSSAHSTSIKAVPSIWHTLSYQPLDVKSYPCTPNPTSCPTACHPTTYHALTQPLGLSGTVISACHLSALAVSPCFLCICINLMTMFSLSKQSHQWAGLG